MAYTSVSAAQFADLEGCGDWRFLLGAIHADFRAGSFTAAASLVARIAEVAEDVDHHPDVAVRYPDRVRVSLTTHAVGGLTTHDVELARHISALAAAADATAEPTTPQSLEIALDTMDADRIRPFWAAILGYEDDGHGALVDPQRLGPAMWFQQMDRPRTDRDRFHIDVTVPHDVAEQRIAAALAAGGTLVEDRYARAWWVLADADGNEACVCTWQDR
ncbi:VOC family protein [Nitriliruptor alkaliphilus]|uniref:VOC family protein n=1 Tax=Nitriliruptor alkaliphilus TaxID=427918 RepID=UPI000698E06D|nr:VOC family protein [Nitriliruptor alkaliphilus]